MVNNELDLQEIKKELVFSLRNADIFSTTERNVTTASTDSTLDSDDYIIIDKENVKNIRSITIGETTLSYGDDYTVDINYSGTESKQCKISFTSSQTGECTVQYDYGTDKIFPDYPRKDLSITSYPRMGLDIINILSKEGGIGGRSNLSEILMEVIVVAEKITDLDDYVKDTRSHLLDNKKDFYNINFITITETSPVMVLENGSNELFKRNITMKIPFYRETM